MIETIASLTAANAAGQTPATLPGQGTPQTDFGAWLTRELDSVNQKILVADTQLRKLAVGEATNLHETMIALESAKLSFELVMQVRNRVLEAYQDVMLMQI